MKPGNFDDVVKEIAIYVRGRLAEVEAIHSVQFSIDVSGRAHDGDLEVKYEIGSSYSEGGVVKGARLEVVIEEYLRRFGWDKRNQPLCISFNPESVTDDGVPF